MHNRYQICTYCIEFSLFLRQHQILNIRTNKCSYINAICWENHMDDKKEFNLKIYKKYIYNSIYI
jgi:hypothetical protein